jgi:hypothetical protein
MGDHGWRRQGCHILTPCLRRLKHDSDWLEQQQASFIRSKELLDEE